MGDGEAVDGGEAVGVEDRSEAAVSEDSRVAGDSREEEAPVAVGSAHPPAWSRFLRRMLRPFITPAEMRRIRQAIAEVERHTTATLRVEIVGRAGGRDLFELARVHFKKHPTPDGHGVLVLVSHLEHRFVIWGEADVHDRAGHPLWQKAARTLEEHFMARQYADGLAACVRELGAELAHHFPSTNG